MRWPTYIYLQCRNALNRESAALKLVSRIVSEMLTRLRVAVKDEDTG